MTRLPSRRSTVVVVATAVIALASCKSIPAAGTPAIAPAAQSQVSLDRKVAWTLRLEQQRQLRDSAGPTAAVKTDAAGRLLRAPATVPDLLVLAADPDPLVRRRAVEAIGRVRVPEGGPVLIASLKDDDEFVREAAVFGLGLLGARDHVAALTAVLTDPSPRVRGRAIEALGLIGDASAAGAVATAAADCRARMTAIAPDDETWPMAPEVEICRLALFSLVRLRQYDALARVALDDTGKPAATWWPVAYALQRLRDPKSAAALATLSDTPGVTTASFALRGLASLGDPRAATVAKRVLADPRSDFKLRIVAVAALGRTGGPEATDLLTTIAADRATRPALALAAIDALGAGKDPNAFDVLIAFSRQSSPSIRSAALAAAAAVNPEQFLLVIGSLPADADWTVRASLASTLAKLPPDRVRGAIEELVDDTDARVKGPALEALAAVKAPDLVARLTAALDQPDFVVRATAARLFAAAKPEGGATKLADAYTRGASDAALAARLAAVDGIAGYGLAPARETLRRALADPEWPVRLHAAARLSALGESDLMSIVPAPLRQPATFFESPALLHPEYSPLALIETRFGTIEITLDVVHAPLTTAAFIELARAGFYNGMKVHRLVPNFVIQAGDPRGDGEGGPGFSLKDELSPTPFLRGSVGMALDGRDTGGSQFFIALSPQPHLDGQYTVFGKVSGGFDVLDRISQWDVIDAVRILDGK